eukprot:COSAG04_NODE_1730_length_5772_cov_79.772078_5_plen_83_part_00
MAWLEAWQVVERVPSRLGADVDARDTYGETALMAAAVWGHVECAIALLAGGADRTLRNHEGETALELAEKWRKPKVAAALRG